MKFMDQDGHFKLVLAQIIIVQYMGHSILYPTSSVRLLHFYIKFKLLLTDHGFFYSLLNRDFD